MKKKLRITILVDDPESWIVRFARKIREIAGRKHKVVICHRASEVLTGDILILLGCVTIVGQEILKKNTVTICVHESDLPKGKGFSPLSWQVLEGKKSIPIVLFKAVRKLDAGSVYFRDFIELDGTELLPEIKEKQGNKTVELVLRFISAWPDVKPKRQRGKATVYRRRTCSDDMLDTKKSIKEQFNRLRVADNKKFPAWFRHNGVDYVLRIYKKNIVKS